MDFEQLSRRLEAFTDHKWGEGASDASVREAQRLIEVELPNSFLAFLNKYGWGGVEYIELFGLGDDVPDHLNLVAVVNSERNEMNPRLPKSFIPVLNDGFGNLYCLDTSAMKEGECPVVFWNHELPPDQRPEIVAQNFLLWVNDLLNDL